MFGSLGWSEILLLFVVSLVVFGPDKLPQVARDAGRMLRQVREMAQGARNQLRSELGPEFGDLDLNSLNPKTFVRKHLFEGDDPFTDPLRMADPSPGRRPGGSAPLRDGEPPPYDTEAT
ncbi:MAG: twin-arginine translocase subunit TatB [Actinobacteria bacterium]|nr:twin-arginine translocase subunit TatB [Actinomycetota bacterium]MBI3687966.1 twin-arginine translocase subunit TatB [Actinomycetota bacterium]